MRNKPLIALAVFVGLAWLIGAAACKAPAARPAAQASARLGDTRETWIAIEGEPRTGTGILGERFGKDIDVTWHAGADGAQRSRHIELLFERERPVVSARDIARGLRPVDAAPERTYTGPAGQTVEVFRSATLRDVFPVDAFGGAEPGTFIQIAERGGPMTSRVVLGLGDNP